jgi:hypothetical protein
VPLFVSFFGLSNLQLALILFGIVIGCTLLGALVGRMLSRHVDTLREPLGVLQAALLGLVALILAFGMTMAVGRYDSRRAAVVDDANAIGTTYLRAQTLHEPVRTRSLELLRQYTDDVIVYSEAVPGSSGYEAAVTRAGVRQRELWQLAGRALDDSPTDSAPRLYVETLNEMIDMQSVRVSVLSNRVPSAVLVITLVGAAMGLGLLALYLAMLSRGVVSVIIAALFVSLLLFLTFDLDRPARGFVKVPAAPLVALRASMELPPAAAAPQEP